jgi:hypothetical protein
MGVVATPETMQWKGARLGHSRDLCNGREPEGLQEQNVQGATSIDEDSVELDIIDDGLDNERVPPRL